MCNIWKRQKNNDLSLSEMKKFLSDPVLSDLRTITLTGGEPFMKTDLPEICKLINANCKELIQLYISTNGSESGHIFEQIKSILNLMPVLKRLRIGVSFDHIGSKHDRIRRKEGIHENALGLIERIRGYDDPRIVVQGNITIGPHNIEDLEEIHDYFQRINLKIFWFPAMASENFYENMEFRAELDFNDGQRAKLKEFIRVIRKETNSLNDFYYYSGLLEGVQYDKRVLPCTAGSRFLQINAEGDVFPCYVIPKNFKFGNIRERSLKEIWYSERTNDLRNKLKDCETCKTCYQWYDGYALSQNIPYLFRCLVSNPLIGGRVFHRYFKQK
jgi:MoaA/NifB/PqqE/SkfB family radical SAM enzyme